MTEEIAEVLISEITGIGDEPNPTTIDPIFVESIEKMGVQKPIALNKKDKSLVWDGNGFSSANCWEGNPFRPAYWISKIPYSKNCMPSMTTL